MMMKRIGAWMLLALLALVGEWHGRCYGCVEEERVGLLEIKALIDPDGYGFYWRHWVHSSNCCEWYGIECDNTTRRVIQLSLRAARDQISVGDWVLNASLFLPFKELQSLDLSSNGLVGCFQNQGFEVLSSKLRKLEALHLSANRFNDEGILSCFTRFSALKSLGLSNNQLTGSGSFNGSLGALPSLKILSLKETNLSGTSISQGAFFNSSTLEELYLDRTSLPLNFLRNIGALPALKVLSVCECDLHGTLPAQGKTPERKYQFGTFDESSYEGNPFLCGPPLRNNCSEEESSSQPMPNDDEEDDGFIDMEFFYISFGVCYTVVVMTIAAILYINPYWRCRWFKFIEDCIDTCNYFLVAIFHKFTF